MWAFSLQGFAQTPQMSRCYALLAGILPCDDRALQIAILSSPTTASTASLYVLFGKLPRDVTNILGLSGLTQAFSGHWQPFHHHPLLQKQRNRVSCDSEKWLKPQLFSRRMRNHSWVIVVHDTVSLILRKPVGQKHQEGSKAGLCQAMGVLKCGPSTRTRSVKYTPSSEGFL